MHRAHLHGKAVMTRVRVLGLAPKSTCDNESSDEQCGSSRKGDSSHKSVTVTGKHDGGQRGAGTEVPGPFGDTMATDAGGVSSGCRNEVLRNNHGLGAPVGRPFEEWVGCARGETTKEVLRSVGRSMKASSTVERQPTRPKV